MLDRALRRRQLTQVQLRLRPIEVRNRECGRILPAKRVTFRPSRSSTTALTVYNILAITQNSVSE